MYTLKQLRTLQTKTVKILEQAREKGDHEVYAAAFSLYQTCMQKQYDLEDPKTHGLRYEYRYGFNTKQFWVWDNLLEALIDPPTEVLDQIDEMKSQSDIDWREIEPWGEWLEDLCNEQKPDWLNDIEYMYFDADMDY